MLHMTARLRNVLCRAGGCGEACYININVIIFLGLWRFVPSLCILVTSTSVCVVGFELNGLSFQR